MSGDSVFIVHSHRDLENDWLPAFVSALREQKLNVWFDVQDLKPGQDFVVAVERAIRESDTFIAIVPRPASLSPWVLFEVGAAIQANKRLIVVADPSSATSIPLDLRGQLVALQDPEETAREVAQAIGAQG